MQRWTVAGVAALVVAASTMLFVLIAARTVEQGEHALAQQRIGLILTETSAAVETALQLGLPLTEINQVQGPLDRIVSRSRDILAADVIGLDRITAFSTDRGAPGEPIPQVWADAINAPDRRRDFRWLVREPASITVGVPVYNDFDQVAGWVAVVMQRDALADPLATIPERSLAALPYAVLAALGSFLVVSIGLYPQSRVPKRARAVLVGEKADLTRDPLAPVMAGAVATSAHASAAIDETKAALQWLDRAL